MARLRLGILLFRRECCQAFVGGLKNRVFLQEKMEPMIGFEPMTDGLRNRCSTAELHWRKRTVGPAFCRWLGCATGERTCGKIYAAIGGNATGKMFSKLAILFPRGWKPLTVGNESKSAVSLHCAVFVLICLTSRRVWVKSRSVNRSIHWFSHGKPAVASGIVDWRPRAAVAAASHWRGTT